MIPTLSAVIAVHNGAHFLPRCLSAINSAADSETEIILVDDGSTDNSAEIGEKLGAKIIRLKKCSGAANARNEGVRQAAGEIILFVDADVIVRPDTIGHLRKIFRENPNCSAVFGSYDDAPAESDFFSQYRNLTHHYFHQIGSSQAETFWTGLGAVKRAAFLEVGGFDARKFQTPSIEDIDLGCRLRQSNHQVLLVPDLQAKHLKKWTFYSILKTDFWYRAVPWAELMLQNPEIKFDLNVKTSQKISAFLAACFLFSLFLLIFDWRFVSLSLGALTLLLIINKDFYAFFWACKGPMFTMFVIPMNILYFAYSTLAFAYSWVNVRIIRYLAAVL